MSLSKHSLFFTMWMHISELHLCWSSQTGKKKVTSCHRIEEMILVLRITFSEKNELTIHDLDTCWNIHALFYKQQEVRLWMLLLWITGPAGWRATAFLMNAGDLCMYAQWDMRSRDASARFPKAYEYTFMFKLQSRWVSAGKVFVSEQLSSSLRGANHVQEKKN